MYLLSFLSISNDTENFTSSPHHTEQSGPRWHSCCRRDGQGPCYQHWKHRLFHTSVINCAEGIQTLQFHRHLRSLEEIKGYYRNMNYKGGHNMGFFLHYVPQLF